MKISSNRPGALADTTVPILFRLKNPEDQISFSRLLESEPGLNILDQIRPQLKDLVKLENPEKTLNENEYLDLIGKKLNGTVEKEYGVWAYYPWNKTVIHMLDEEEFIRVRTIRNAYKITFEEQALLRTKKIGIIGLSVGQSVALTIAIERGAGEIRIADFDTLELSNLNRIRTGIHNIGLKKTTVVAREIAEIDPFLKVICFSEGVTRENISDFFDDGGMLDLLIEECDSVDVKILAREEAKKRRIPVIMDTSDRGMLDIERFDLEPDYPILHGLIDPKITFDFLSSLTTSEEKLPYIIPILGADNLSVRLKASGLEVGKTITTWPQLGSDVVLGGALCANASRRILLGERIYSGRNYVDLALAIQSESVDNDRRILFEENLSDRRINEIIHSLGVKHEFILSQDNLETIINAAVSAPSPGNKQQWKFCYSEGLLFIFIDKEKSRAYGDNLDIASSIAIGCALENIRQICFQLNLNVNIDIIDNPSLYPLSAIAKFDVNSTSNKVNDLSNYIFARKTTRDNECNPIETKELENFSASISTERVQINLITDKSSIQRISNLICEADKIRFTNIQGHQEFYKNEVRWTKEDAAKKKDGLDLSLFDLSASDRIGLKLAEDRKVIEFINKIGGGKGFEKISSKTFVKASAIAYVTTNSFKREDLIQAGMQIEQMWLFATKHKIGIYPVTVLPMLLSFLEEDKENFNNTTVMSHLSEIKRNFDNIVLTSRNNKLVFMCRVASEPKVSHRSTRKQNIEKFITI